MSLHSRLVQYRYTVKFHTPAFLGDAEQNGAWRTPPFKALLRQWWRVAFAAGRHAESDLVKKMRTAEAELFGSAADADSSSKSMIRIRLSHWEKGKLSSWDGLEQPKVHHPEADKAKNQIGPLAYLGYGPLEVKGGTQLKKNAAIDAGETAALAFAFPRAHEPALRTALWLLNQFGTLGGRSRNGWGSLELMPIDQATKLEGRLESGLLADWRQALALDWPHAIGSDGRALVWQTEPYANWRELMRGLATLKIGLRTQFKFETGKNAPRTEARHWLSYPVTNHSVGSWGNQFRLPNSLRFKVRPDAKGKLCGLIFHVPCLPPREFRPDKDAITAVWQRVHAHLDATQNLTRIPA